MERRHIKWLPLLLAGLFLAYQYFSSEKFVNPETGRKSHVAMSTRDEALLGLQTYQQVLAQSETISTGPEFETVNGVAISLSDMDYNKQRAVMGALGAGAQFGVLMPFSRKHESEADAIGLHYMARAGYDPRESILFWQHMENAGRAQPPEFLSSHP